MQNNVAFHRENTAYSMNGAEGGAWPRSGPAGDTLGPRALCPSVWAPPGRPGSSRSLSAAGGSDTELGTALPEPSRPTPGPAAPGSTEAPLTISNSMSRSLQAPKTGGFAAKHQKRGAAVRAAPRDPPHGDTEQGLVRVAYRRRVSSAPWAFGSACRTPRRTRRGRGSPLASAACGRQRKAVTVTHGQVHAHGFKTKN